MYSKIQQEKKQGFSRDAAARHLGLSWQTVDRYWDMTPDTYESLHTQNHSRILDKHEAVVLDWLEQFPDLSAAQVKDWIHEHYNEVYPERTVRSYVQKMRDKYGILKVVKTREYGCTPELPPGQQLQADFGEYWCIRKGMNRIKLYVVVFILAHSRYKYVIWQLKPFTAIDFVRCLESCFRVLGGVPQELVIDQDKLMTVSENSGDIIHTYEFERCKNRHSISIWLCRKGDPESKGMVESCVKFVKYNFARNRYFYDLNQWNSACNDWLIRTGNGKVHSETKKIPAEVFEVEKKHLRPVTFVATNISCNNILSTPVRKNNTIRYKGSRYTVPFGTYTNIKEATIKEVEGNLEIYDLKGQLIARHELAVNPGELKRNTHHIRDNSEKINILMDQVKTALGSIPQADEFLSVIHKRRGRYIRDQLNIILKVANSYDLNILQLALKTCCESKLDSANDFRDFAKHIFLQEAINCITTTPPLRLLPELQSSINKDIKVNQPSPELYMNLVKGGVRDGK